MFLFERDNLTYCSALVMMGKRITRNTLEPKLATFSATYLLAPCTIETTTISVDTERITPSNVKNERSLWARNVSRAIIAGSFSDTPLRGVDFIGISYFTILKSGVQSVVRFPLRDENYRK